jgi:hypothetical protein
LGQFLLYNNRMIDFSLENRAQSVVKETFSVREKKLSLMASLAKNLVGNQGGYLIHYLSVLLGDKNANNYYVYYSASVLSNIKLNGLS